MPQKDVVIFGTGDMAAVVKMYLAVHSDYRIVGVTVDAVYCNSLEHEGLPLVPWENLEDRFPPDKVLLLGPLTYQRMNTVRRDRYLEGKARGYSFARFIHPDCNIYTDNIGENCVILERNVIQPFAEIGNNTIIWSGNHIGHHVTIGSHVFIASQVGIAGSTTIGDECHLGGQAGITHGLTLGRACAVLNGAIVAKDQPDYTVLVGPATPAKPFDSRRLLKLL